MGYQLNTIQWDDNGPCVGKTVFGKVNSQLSYVIAQDEKSLYRLKGNDKFKLAYGFDNEELKRLAEAHLERAPHGQE